MRISGDTAASRRSLDGVRWCWIDWIMGSIPPIIPNHFIYYQSCDEWRLDEHPTCNDGDCEFFLGRWAVRWEFVRSGMILLSQVLLVMNLRVCPTMFLKTNVILGTTNHTWDTLEANRVWFDQATAGKPLNSTRHWQHVYILWLCQKICANHRRRFYWISCAVFVDNQ